jgi:hypothetical protein
LDKGEPRCIAFGGLRVDDAIADAILRVVGPGAVAAVASAEKEVDQRNDQVREAFKRDLEAARYAADRAFRQYDAADPANRLVASELEARWNKALVRLAEVESKITAHDAAKVVTVADQTSLGTLATDLKSVWAAPSTDARLKKRIVRTVIHEVIADIDSNAAEIVLVIHWIGGIHSESRGFAEGVGSVRGTAERGVNAHWYLPPPDIAHRPGEVLPLVALTCSPGAVRIRIRDRREPAVTRHDFVCSARSHRH